MFSPSCPKHSVPNTWLSQSTVTSAAVSTERARTRSDPQADDSSLEVMLSLRYINQKLGLSNSVIQNTGTYSHSVCVCGWVGGCVIKVQAVLSLDSMPPFSFRLGISSTHRVPASCRKAPSR